MNAQIRSTAGAPRRRACASLVKAGLVAGGLAWATLAGAAAPALAQAAPDYAAILAAPGRSEADLATDKRRDPAKLLAFSGVRPGMKVLDIGAGSGYSTDIIARVVGPNGRVYAQNPPTIAERVNDRFQARLASLPYKNVTLVTRPMGNPVPPDVRDLDVVTFFFVYHDTTYQPIDRAEMNKRIFDGLKPGGSLVIADHAANAGDGATVGKTLHRIEKDSVRKEVEAAGFKLVDEGSFLRHPEDPHTEPVFQRNRSHQPVDEFVLRFEKPRR